MFVQAIRTLFSTGKNSDLPMSTRVVQLKRYCFPLEIEQGLVGIYFELNFKY